MALKSLHTRDIETGTYPAIFHPFAVSSLLATALGSAINAEAIQYKQSYLTDRINTEIASDQLNVIDNGLYINKKGIAGLGTSKFDGEGVPHQKTPLVAAGILKNHLHDSYTAGKENRKSTGNASRSSYRSVPSISLTNMEVLGNSGNLDSFISEIQKGILVYDTGDQPNITTGDFSGLISLGYKIENGAIAYPLKNAMMGINMLDFFKQIYHVGTDYRTVFNVITPSLCVTDLKIAGSD
jgi:PmbA protein